MMASLGPQSCLVFHDQTVEIISCSPRAVFLNGVAEGGEGVGVVSPIDEMACH